MLTFKKKFLDAIRCGQKTQTLRLWKYPRLRSGQKDFIPGVGPIEIDLAEEVLLENLTDEDAIPDGFSSMAALQNELHEIYGNPLVGKLYRIRFHLSESPQGRISKSLTSVSSSPVSPITSEIPAAADPQTPQKDGLELHSFERTLAKSGADDSALVSLPSQSFLTTEQVIERLINRCRVYRNICDWNHEPGKSKDFFAVFRQSPRDEFGIPTLEGRKLWRLIKEHVSPEDWESLSWIASEVCRAWTEWKYAIEKWNCADEDVEMAEITDY